MQSLHRHGSSPLLFLILTIISSLHPTSTATYFKQHYECAPSPLTCGALNITVDYPFRVSGRLDYCGYPGFVLTCINNTSLMIDIGGTGYQVKNIDYSDRLLTIFDTNLSSQTCPLPSQNATLDPSLFQYSDRDQILSLFLNCTSPASAYRNIQLYNIKCLFNLTRSYSYFLIGSRSLPAVSANCDSTLIVPVNSMVGDQLASGTTDIEPALREGFTLLWLPGKGWCMNCRNSGGVCGYNFSSPSTPACFCSYGLVPGNCLSGSSSRKRIIIGFAIGFAGFLFMCLLFFLYCSRLKKLYKSRIFRRRKSENEQNLEDYLEKYGSLAPQRYKYSEVRKMTKSFCEKLGQGGYGTVFKGSLKDGHLIAVKVLAESKANGEEFINEVASIGRTSHVNIVSLLGFCLEGSKRTLIYDYMPNGSLEKYKATLGWEDLYKITIGVARGLEYLHHGCNTRMVHFDIKPQNILLDQDFCPKISDFGLAKLCYTRDSKLSMAGTRGTIGYIAPEVISRDFGVVSSKSDVYSYGMMLLEMVGVRHTVNAYMEQTSEVYFPHWIYEHMSQDGSLQDLGVTRETEETARKMIIIGLWCIQTLPGNRPSMSRVTEMLEGSITVLQMPPKPYLSSNVETLNYSSSISVSQESFRSMRVHNSFEVVNRGTTPISSQESFRSMRVHNYTKNCAVS